MPLEYERLQQFAPDATPTLAFRSFKLTNTYIQKKKKETTSSRYRETVANINRAGLRSPLASIFQLFIHPS
jgi:hypothetical protein